MTAKTRAAKQFDCVEFKQQSQERLMAEYEERRTEFPSYVDFIQAKVFEDEWSRQLWESIGGQQQTPLREEEANK